MKRRTTGIKRKYLKRAGHKAAAVCGVIALTLILSLLGTVFTAQYSYAEPSDNLTQESTAYAPETSQPAEEPDKNGQGTSGKTGETTTAQETTEPAETTEDTETAETGETSKPGETSAENSENGTEKKDQELSEKTDEAGKRDSTKEPLITVAANSESATILVAYVDATEVNLRTGPGTEYSAIARISKTNVVILEKVKDKDGDPWCRIVHGDGDAYIYAEFLTNERSITIDYGRFESFPKEYRYSLAVISALYPNYSFIADKIDLTIDDVVKAHLGRKVNDPWGNEQSSYEDIEYYVNPVNFLNYTDIYMFLKQSRTGNENLETLTKLVSGTFLDTAEYKNIIMEAARQSGVSPYAIASTIIQEQGSAGSSPLISGTYPGYEGYYNFWNFGAVDGDPINQGLKYAKTMGWNSKSKAIIGGAKEYSEGYISNNQDTYYYKDYNVINQVWWHEYATAVYDAWSSAEIMRNAFQSDANGVLTFRIPVYYKKVGDVNLDGSVTAVDYAMIRNHCAGTSIITNEKMLRQADVNGDGNIDSADCIAVKQYIMDN